MCTVAMKLKKISLTPLLYGCFWCFGGVKIAIWLFSFTTANALSQNNSKNLFQLHKHK